MYAGASTMSPSSHGSPGARSGSSGRSHSRLMTSVAAIAAAPLVVEGANPIVIHHEIETMQSRNDPLLAKDQIAVGADLVLRDGRCHAVGNRDVVLMTHRSSPPLVWCARRSHPPRRHPRFLPQACGGLCRCGRGRRTRCHRYPREPRAPKSRPFTPRRVTLRGIACDHELRREAQAREEHLHLLRGGVLGLVENHEGVVEVCDRA